MTRNTIRPAASRRKALKLIGAAGIAAVAAPHFIRSAEAQGRRIVVRDSGGPFTKAYGQAFYEPFKKATGIEVVGVTSTHEPTSQIKAMVDTKTYTWDLASIGMAAVDQLVKEGDYVEKHRLDSEAVIKQIPAEYRNEYSIGSDVYTTVLAYRTDKLKATPTSWKGLWDVAKVPGRRGMRKYPFDTVEQALLADGVASDKVYPCDFDHAFKKLDQIKPHAAVWWTRGAQTTQMLVSGEVDMIPTWIARAQAAVDEGAPVGVMWEQNLWGVDAWAILKGGPNADICREFIRFCSDAKVQAAMAPNLANGPTNPGAYEFIDKKRAAMLSTSPENRAKGIAIDNAFWAANKDKAIERFNSWILA
jgi:putative spermidine/putrescine transport system substrate-binding protein